MTKEEFDATCAKLSRSTYKPEYKSTIVQLEKEWREGKAYIGCHKVNVKYPNHSYTDPLEVTDNVKELEIILRLMDEICYRVAQRDDYYTRWERCDERLSKAKAQIGNY
jgi:hypothetical protein